MAKRRFQNPKPFREGNWWWINPWVDLFIEGRLQRKRQRMKVCPSKLSDREARKIAVELIRPMNQGLQTIGSATRFADYINGTYIPTVLPVLAVTTRASYLGTLRKYLLPVFGDMPLRDMNALTLQQYFSGLSASDVGAPTVLKIREVLSAALASAVRYDLLIKNPMLAVQIPRTKLVNKKKQKPHITPEEFERLIEFVDEPYATMIYVAVFSGLRISELIALKWDDVHHDAITVDERCCRGDWSVTKTAESSSTIGVDSSVVDRIQRLKSLTVKINWGGRGARKQIKLVRSCRQQDLVFQSLRTGTPMRDGNILRRHLRPAASRLGMDPKKATWRSLRTSCATWLVQAGADVKSVQGQLRHSRISTTMDIYAQHVPENQRRAVTKMMQMVQSRRLQQDQLKTATVN